MANLPEETINTVFNLQRRLLQLIAESQPVATSATLNLLAQSIEQTQTIADASAATIQEVKKDWNLA
jgi:hypothetical protein